MNVVDAKELPNQFNVMEHVWIQMRDGCKLSARIWLPEGAQNAPVPAILEYIPYRTRDWKRMRDNQMHGYFSGHGYAAIRVDMRGSGDSEGILEDEYLPTEQEDAEDILKWIEDQSWSNGKVGMIGISWGGFNGLQTAALRPSQLKAVISICSSDDRYADDVHYMGGLLLGNNLSWASTMFALNSLPPDPEIVGDCWKEMWLKRLNGSGLWLDKWMRHQHRDGYWKHASVGENYDDIQCPVMAVCGWTDGYSNTVFRLMENLKVPKKGLIGPWGHKYPQEGAPGPAIGFLQEALRWWDYWLKDVDTGIMDEPMIRSWMVDSYEPKPGLKSLQGRWIGEEQWPSANIQSEKFQFQPDRLVIKNNSSREISSIEPISISSPLHVGLVAGKWYSTGVSPDLPADQRMDHGGAVTFESDQLENAVEIHGAPIVDLQLSSNKPVAMVAVRLIDIAPDLKETRVSYGVLNLCHRHSHEEPEPLVPNQKENIQIELNEMAYSFKVGHRLQVSISTVYWPLVWPSPEPVTLTVYPEKSELTLPVRHKSKVDEQLPDFQSSEVVGSIEPEVVIPSENNLFISHDMGNEMTTLTTVEDEGELYFPDTRLSYYSRTEENFSHHWDEFTSVRGEVEALREITRDTWNVRTETKTVLTCDEHSFYIHATLDAYVDEERIFSKNWDEVIKRQLI